jgi:hypothetical protein
VATGQTWPQDPQFFASVDVFTHAELHTVCPVGQLQLLATQVWPGMLQILPHVPQFLESVVRSVHAVPQYFCGSWQG